MRLIDFDKLIEQYGDFYSDFDVNDLKYLKKEYLPFVDAIPIEWMKKKYNEVSHYGLGIEDWSIKDCYGLVLEDWEKENEIDR